jgi:hypothetical protein
VHIEKEKGIIKKNVKGKILNITRNVMFKKIFLLIGMWLLVGNSLVFAQESADAGYEMEIKAQQKILSEVGKQVVFDVSQVAQDYENYAEFQWDFGDGGSAEGMGVLHGYQYPGYFQVDLVMKNSETDQKKILLDVFIYHELLLGIVDGSIDQNKIDEVEQKVFDGGKLLWIVGNDKKSSSSDDLVNLVLENNDVLQKADSLVFWGSGNFGLDSLLQLKQRSEVDLSNFEVISVSNQSFASIKKTADTVYNLVNPKSLVLVKENSLDLLEQYQNVENWTSVLTNEGIGFELIGLKDKFRLEPTSEWLVMSGMINYALFQGVPLSTITLILLMPLIALILAVARQVVGIRAFGIYVPALITIAFLESGLRYGTIVFLIILAVGTIARLILKKVRILYLPRMALILTLVALGMLLVMYLAAYFDVVGLKTLSIVPLLTMVILTEKFVSAQIRYGFGSALKLTMETFILSAICYLFLSWQTLKVLVISYPEAVLLTIPFLIVLGRWSGLRLSEYWRFRRLLK